MFGFIKRIAIGIIKPFLNEEINKATPAQLFDAITQNKDLWSHIPVTAKGQGITYKQRFGQLYERYEHYITADLLLDYWIKKDYPDLYNVIVFTKINNENIGIRWFERQVEQLKAQIRNM